MLKIIALFFVFSFVGSVLAQNQTDNSARAKAFIDALAKKDFAAAYEFFADVVKKQLPVEALPQIREQMTGESGEFRSVKEVKKAADDKNIIVVIEFEKGAENILVKFDDQNKIVGFVPAPPEKSAAAAPLYETPKYADANSFEEKEVTVGAGEWALPGTLTMPKGKTNVAAVVLIHGSGPNDRDETLGGNKIFKDLAWGLASRGIAVLRYEKRTRQYGAKLGAKNFTVNEETVEDAVSAAQLLMKTPNVDAKKVFVLGHSLGGYLLPRIAEKDKAIAGLISFAGATRPLAEIIVEQYIYIANLDGNISPAEQVQIDQVKEVSTKIKSLTEKDRNSGEIIFYAPVSYYLDLQNYDPAQSAAKLTQPMLILQGESDYQVTMRDFNNWKTALGNRKNVTFKSYPKLTHAFSETGGAKPSPQDYEKPNHVNAQVVGDLADWITKTSK